LTVTTWPRDDLTMWQVNWKSPQTPMTEITTLPHASSWTATHMVSGALCSPLSRCHGPRLLSGLVYQASLLCMRENQQPIKCKLHSVPKWWKYRSRLLTVPLPKCLCFDVIILSIYAYSVKVKLRLGLGLVLNDFRTWPAVCNFWLWTHTAVLMPGKLSPTVTWARNTNFRSLPEIIVDYIFHP